MPLSESIHRLIGKHLGFDAEKARAVQDVQTLLDQALVERAIEIERLEMNIRQVSAARDASEAALAELRNVPIFVPPGHFYSPIADPRNAAPRLAWSEASPPPEALPGLEISRAAMRALWSELLPYLTSAPFGSGPTPGLRYQYDNPNYAQGDASVLHAMLRHYRPRRVIEVGSGWSSACMIDTAEHYLDGEVVFTFIEPFPDLLHSLIGGQSKDFDIRVCGVQSTPLELFSKIESGDFLFIDSSHILAVGSDVQFELFEILPILKSGVVVHFHDAFWPFEYPRSWVVDENRSWNELYALQAFLTDNQSWEILFFNDYFGKMEAGLIAETYPAFGENPGGGLWLVKR